MAVVEIDLTALSLVIHLGGNGVVNYHFKGCCNTKTIFLETCSHAPIHARSAGSQLERWSPEDSPLNGPTAAESSPLRFNMRFTDDRSARPIMSTHY